MNVRMKYVVRRLNKDGTERWYWSKPGHPVTRLPDNAAERWKLVEYLNRTRTPQDTPEPVSGSVAWCIAQYKLSRRYKRLRGSSLRIYDRWLKSFEEELGKEPVQAITAHVVSGLLARYEGKPSTQSHIVAAMRGVIRTARKLGHFNLPNPCAEPDIEGKEPRARYIFPDELDRLLDACADHRHGVAIRRLFHLLLFTAQRPIDCLKMTRASYDGDFVSVVQQKTHKAVAVKAHRLLKAELAKSLDSTLLVPLQGSAKRRYEIALQAFHEICAIAKVSGVQMRDFRRTAVVYMAEERIELPLIAAVGGWSIDHTTKIIEGYMPKTKAMTATAIALWEKAKLNAKSWESNA